MPELTDFPDGSVALLLSSRTSTGLFREAAALADFVRREPQTTLAQISDVLAATRTPLPWRALVRLHDREPLLGVLDGLAAGCGSLPVPGASVHMAQAEKRDIAMVLPGQGGQKPGMGRELYRISSGYRDVLDRLDEMFTDPMPSVRGYLVEGTSSATVQPALFTHMIALEAMWREWGVTPRMVVGHSQGEVAAACVAGAITEEQGVQVITQRSRLSGVTATTGRYAMLVVGTDRDAIERQIPEISGWAEVSVVNSPSLHVVTGEVEALAELETLLQAEDCFARRIDVDFPAHTHLMDLVKDEFVAAVGAQPFAEGRIPFIGSTVGGPVPAGRAQGPYWFANMRHRVRFDLAIRYAIEQGVSSFIELSGHPVLLMAIAENAEAAEHSKVLTLCCGRHEEPAATAFADRLAEFLVSHRDVVIQRPRRHVRVPLRFPPPAWDTEVLWAPPDHDAASPGRTGTAPQCLVDSWEMLGSQPLLEAERILLSQMKMKESWIDPLRREAMRLGAVIVTEDATVGIMMLDSELWEKQDTSSALALVHDALGKFREIAVPEVLVVTTGSEDRSQLGGSTPDPVAAAAAAMVRCMAADVHSKRVRHLDLDPAHDLEACARHILTAAHLKDEAQLAVLGSALQARRLVPAELSTPREEFVEAVVLGGTGVVGLEVCRRLAEQGVRRVVVVSRNQPRGPTAAALDAITNANRTEITHISCDITDCDGIRDLAARLSQNSGPRLIIHCVVDYAATAASKWAAAIAPKSGVVPRLREHLIRPGDHLMVFSSLSAGIGARGHGTYAATNRVLEVASLTNAPEDTSVIRWGLWPRAGHGGTIGASLEAIQAAGLEEMDPAAAVAAALAAPPGLVSIVAADWARISEAFSLLGSASLFTHLVSSTQASPPEPGLTATFEPEPESSPPTDPAPSTPVGPEQPHAEELSDVVERVVREALGYGSDAEFDFLSSLVVLGIDSIQALKVQHELADPTAGAVTAADILRGASLQDLINAATKESR